LRVLACIPFVISFLCACVCSMISPTETTVIFFYSIDSWPVSVVDTKNHSRETKPFLHAQHFFLPPLVPDGFRWLIRLALATAASCERLHTLGCFEKERLSFVNVVWCCCCLKKPICTWNFVSLQGVERSTINTS
jgi:hypothetical protein